MDFDDTTRRIVAHLETAADAYLLGPRDFAGTFTLLDHATLRNLHPDSVGVLPGEVVRRLEQSGTIERFEVKDETKAGFRVAS